jgi:hypothetical protein
MMAGIAHGSAVIVRERVGVLLLAALRAALIAWAAWATPCFATSAWIADASTLRRVDTTSGRVLARIELPNVRAIAATSGGGAWALRESDLVYVGADAASIAVDIGGLGYGEALQVGVDPFDDCAWVVTSRGLLAQFDKSGAMKRGVTLPAQPSALAVGLDQSVWLAGEGEIVRYSKEGLLAQSIGLDAEWTQPVVSLWPDPLRGTLWAVGVTLVASIATDADRPSRIADAGGPVVDSALLPRTGELWLLGERGLQAFDREFGRRSVDDSAGDNMSGASALAYDAAAHRMLVALPRSLVSIDPDARSADRIELDSRVRLTATPFRLWPGLSLIRPPEGASLIDARPSVHLGLDALCNGVACEITDGYLASVHVRAFLDQHPIAAEPRFDDAHGLVSFAPSAALHSGSNRFTAQATDRFGHASNEIDTTWTLLDSSPPRSLAKAPNQRPTVSLTSPVNGARFAPGSDIALSATASDPDGTVSKVEFYRDGTTLLGTDSTNPYSIVWTAVPAGIYSLSAKATDNKGATTTSATVSITIAPPPNAPPGVAFTSPADGSVVEASPGFTLVASATDSDGVIASLQFYDGLTLLGTVPGSGSSMSATWPVSEATTGLHTYRTVATDNGGATATAAVTLQVAAPPLVALVLPAACIRLQDPANVILQAEAAVTDGSITSVAFFHGDTLIGTSTAEPFTISWAGVREGTYVITAKATDDRGATAVSSGVSIVVESSNAKPVVAMTSPAEGATFAAGSSVTLTATANDGDGTIAKVEFLRGTTLIGTSYAPPHSALWSAVAPGNYLLAARATDNLGAIGTSPAVAVTVEANHPPIVSLDAPAEGTRYLEPAIVELKATASDSDGSIAFVDFYDGATLIGRTTLAPYAITWSNAPAGPHSLTAKATDGAGAVATSAAVAIVVDPNEAPQVSLLLPVGNVYFAPATIALNAAATDADGILRVDYYQGATLVGSAASAPYSYVWDNVAAGAYSITAVAIDGRGKTGTSAAALLNVLGDLQIALVAGVDGAIVADDVMAVSGTLVAPANAGVLVNGRRAQVTADGRFYVNALPLQPGTNTISITAIAQDGQTATRTASVTSTGPSGFAVTAGPTEGLAPLTVAFAIIDRGGVDFQALELDFDSDGTADFIVDRSRFVNGSFELSITYPAGTWTTTTRIRNVSGEVVYATATVVTVLAPLDLEARVRSVFTGMLDRLRSGNIAGALTAFTDTVYEKYRAIFTALGGNLAASVDQMGDLSEVTFQDDIAEYGVVRITPDGPQRFMMYLIRGSDGIWRIEGM